MQSIYTHTRLTTLFPGLPGWADTRKVKLIWILVKQETVSGSGISWAICKSAPRSRQITTPASHHSFFYRLDALPAAQPTASKHRRQKSMPQRKKTYETDTVLGGPDTDDVALLSDHISEERLHKQFIQRVLV